MGRLHAPWARAALVSAVLGAVVYSNTLGASFVWDDRAAVVGNADVQGTTSWWDLVQHDFWGQNITAPDSHKSYRPLTVASFRVNFAVTGAQAAATGFHLVNVLLHSVVSALVAVVASRLPGATAVRSLVAGMLFAVHPVHVEAVASVVGRADVLAALFYLAALLAYMRAASGSRRMSRCGAASWLLLSVVLVFAAALSKEVGFTCFGAFVAWDCAALLRKWWRAVDDAAERGGTGYWGSRTRRDDDELSETSVGSGSVASSASGSSGSSGSTSCTASSGTSATADKDGARGTRGMWRKEVHGYSDSESDMTPLKTPSKRSNGLRRRFSALSTPALSPRVGVVHERDEDGNGGHIRADPDSTLPLVEWAIPEELRRPVRRAISRWFVLVVCAAGFMWVRLGMHRDAPLYRWTILENQFAGMPAGVFRTLSIAYTHVLYAWYLVVPGPYSFDHGFASMTPITQLVDHRNVGTACLWVMVLAAVTLSWRRRWYVGLWAMAAAFASFLPASNIAVFVGTEMAERLLYIPSIALCIAVAQIMPARGRKHSLVSAAKAAGVIVVVALYATRTYQANVAWMDENELFKAGLSATPRSIKALNNMGQSFLNGNEEELRMAEQYIRSAVELHPDYAQAHFNLALALRGLNKPFMDHLERSTVLPDASCKALAYLGHFLVEKFARLPVGPEREAMQWVWLDAKRTLEDSTGLGCRMSLLFHARGMVAATGNEHEWAIGEFEKALQAADEERRSGAVVSANVVATLSMMAQSHKALGRLEQAVELYGTAVSHAPERTDLYSNLGVLLGDMGRFAEASAMHDRALELQPTDAALLSNAGFTAEKMGDLQRAFRLYSAAYDAVPDHAQVAANYNNLRLKLAQAGALPDGA